MTPEQRNRIIENCKASKEVRLAPKINRIKRYMQARIEADPVFQGYVREKTLNLMLYGTATVGPKELACFKGEGVDSH